jgi:hypothetical protein
MFKVGLENDLFVLVVFDFNQLLEFGGCEFAGGSG